jgi:hypothetical protein
LHTKQKAVVYIQVKIGAFIIAAFEFVQSAFGWIKKAG